MLFLLGQLTGDEDSAAFGGRLRTSIVGIRTAATLSTVLATRFSLASIALCRRRTHGLPSLPNGCARSQQSWHVVCNSMQVSVCSVGLR